MRTSNAFGARRARSVRAALALLGTLSFAVAACGGDDAANNANNATTDGGTSDGAGAEMGAADEPFGRVCSNVGKPCTDTDLEGYDLLCLAPQGSAEGKGMCTRECNDLSPACFGVPNGQWAACYLSTGGDNAKKYCAFVCKSNGQVWDCPGTQHCGPDNNGTSICVP